MLHVLMTRGENPLPPKEARELLNAMAQEFDTNFDGKFSYSGLFEVVSMLASQIPGLLGSLYGVSLVALLHGDMSYCFLEDAAGGCIIRSWFKVKTLRAIVL